MSHVAKYGLAFAGVLIACGVKAQITGGVVVAPERASQAVSPSLGLWVGQVKVLTGRVFVDRLGEQRRRDVTLGMRVKENDVITTTVGGSVGILFDDNSTLSLGPRTQIAIHKFAFNSTTHQGYFDARVQRGTLAVQPGRIAQNSPEAMRVSTPAAVLRSKSAAYLVSVEGSEHD